MITDKLKTNPELIPLNEIVAVALDRLIDRRWGSIQITVSCQNGRLKTAKVNEEIVTTFKNDLIDN